VTGCRPYPGLRPFDRDEDSLFFGREQQIDELLVKLGETHFIAVLGTSGSGKSSLVRAGILPALQGGLLARAGARWEIAELRPGNRPMHRLAAACIQQTNWGAGRAAEPLAGDPQSPNPESTDPARPPLESTAIAALEAELRKGPMALNWLLGVRPIDRGGRLLILVDQFEELFRFADQGVEYTRTAWAREAGAIVALLLAAAQHPAVHVVITMRSDFLGDCARHPGLPEAVNAGLYLVPRLQPEQMADAIRLPARLCGGDVEPELVGRLLEDARGEQDQLPLLQHALMRLWDLNGPDRRLLTLAAFDQLGGLTEALNAHAEDAFDALADPERVIAETLFRSLSGRGENGRDTRRPVRIAEVAALAGVDAERVIAVAEPFRAVGRSFLMPPPPGMEGGVGLEPDTMLDIAHESLIRQWHRLQGWTEAEAEEAAIYRRLESDACRRRDKGEASLWTGAELGLVRPWLADQERTARWALRYAAQGDISVKLALAFLAESVAEEDRGRRRREMRRREALRRARLTAIVAGIGFLAMTGLAGWAIYERRHSDGVEQQRTSELFDSTLTHAALLARTEDYAGARERLDGSRRLDGQIPATRRLARDLLARYAEMMGGSAEWVYTGAGAHLYSVAASPDGRWVAACGRRGTVVLLDAASGKLVQRLTGHDTDVNLPGYVNFVAFHPKDNWLASAGEDRRVILWTLPTADRPAVQLRQWLAPAAINALTISPDGTLLATGGHDNAITIWNPESGRSLRTLKDYMGGPPGSTFGLTFSPDGTRLISGGDDGTAAVWDTETGDLQARLTGNRGEVWGVAFSKDGSWVATGGEDGRVVLWDAKGGTPIRDYIGHTNGVDDVGLAERPVEQHAAPLLVSAGSDRTIRIWDEESAVTQRLLQGHDGTVIDVAIEGERLYSASFDQTVRRWSLVLPHQRLQDVPGDLQSVALAPDGNMVAVGDAEGRIRLYSLPDVVKVSELPVAHEGRIVGLVFSPDGKRLASAGSDKLAHLWRIDPDSDLSPDLDLKGHEKGLNAVAFSPNGRILATAGDDGRLGLFDTETGKGRFIRSTQGRTASVAFDDTGTRVFAGDRDDGRVRVWSIADDLPTLVGNLKAASSDELYWAEPAADGTRIAAVGADYVLRVMDRETDNTLARLPGHERQVWKARFLPGGHQVATVSKDATVRLWDLDTQTALFALHLPAARSESNPLWDFDLRCTGPGEVSGTGKGQTESATAASHPNPVSTSASTCWLAVPLTRGKLAVYDLGPLPAGLPLGDSNGSPRAQ
jgi:WD40 repeat protein